MWRNAVVSQLTNNREILILLNMKIFKHWKALIPTAFVSLAATILIIGIVPLCRADSTPATPVPTNAVPAKPVVKTSLTGAELYSMHCNRCHPERYPTERTAAQWKTIMLHMQVRANIPISQSKLILKYLQDNSGR